jgi:hypothetical protein
VVKSGRNKGQKITSIVLISLIDSALWFLNPELSCQLFPHEQSWWWYSCKEPEITKSFRDIACKEKEKSYSSLLGTKRTIDVMDSSDVTLGNCVGRVLTECKPHCQLGESVTLSECCTLKKLTFTRISTLKIQRNFFENSLCIFANLACFASIVTTTREKYAAISARKIFSHIFHSLSLLSLFLFVCDKYCHFVSLTWCFCFHNTFVLSKTDEFSLNCLFHDPLKKFHNLSSIAVNKKNKFDTVSKDS